MVSRDPKFRVLVTDYVWPTTEPERKVLAGIGAEVIEAPDTSEETLASMAVNVDAIMACFAQVTSRVIQAAEKCVVISRYGVGVDNVAVDTATQEGIAVTYVPDYCVDEVSDHVMALLLSWNRQIVSYDQIAKQGRWDGTRAPNPLLRLRGRTLGVVGLGRIGRAVAAKAQAFGLEVLGSDPYLTDAGSAPSGVKVVSLSELLSQSDYIALHPPLNEETRGLIGAAELSQMKSDAFLINCSRGPIINEPDLYAALRDHKIGGAGLDVMEEAAPSAGHPMFQLENVLITPHVAFLSQQSVLELEESTAQATADVLQGRMPKFLVNPAVLPHCRIKLA
jgi:D-3-phosphoglycerate dehydrogenase